MGSINHEFHEDLSDELKLSKYETNIEIFHYPSPSIVKNANSTMGNAIDKKKKNSRFRPERFSAIKYKSPYSTRNIYHRLASVFLLFFISRDLLLSLKTCVLKIKI